MIRFASANTRVVNTERAVAECLEVAFPEGVPADCGAILFQCAIGHKAEKLGAALKKMVPQAVVLGNTCGGVVGRQGVGDSMHEVGIMALCGPRAEYPTASTLEIHSRNAYEKALEAAKALHQSAPNPAAIYLLSPGIDINNTQVLRAFDEVFGPEVVIFGGNAADNMAGAFSLQYVDGVVGEHNGWAVAFNDSTLKAVTRATHGFTAYGEPLIVTRSEGNRIIEFDGKPAGKAFQERLAMPENTPTAMVIAMGALAMELPAAVAEEYGNRHILMATTKIDENGVMYAPVDIPEGTPLWLTVRDEELIFSEQQRSLDFMRSVIGEGEVAAAFQTDCLARGRMLFNKIVKDELITMIQSALADSRGETPPWLGMYGFGEYARLADKNTYHNYTTALIALYR